MTGRGARERYTVRNRESFLAENLVRLPKFMRLKLNKQGQERDGYEWISISLPEESFRRSTL